MISVVIPVRDEGKSLPILYKELRSVFNRMREKHEIIFIDDGSKDNSSKLLSDLQKKDKNIKLIKFRVNFGKSQALSAGLDKAQGSLVVTLDADLQDDPAEIPKLLRKLKQGYDLVSGWRKKRQDPFSKRLASRAFNFGTSLISGVKLHDFNCGLKAMRREVAGELNLHGELHRFIPVIAAKKKFKVTEIAVDHRARQYGKSKYGIGRSWRAAIDLITTLFLADFSERPAHLFGTVGLFLFLIGFIMDSYVSYIRITRGTTEGKIPLLLAGILFMVLGAQLLSTGLIAEMIVRIKQKS